MVYKRHRQTDRQTLIHNDFFIIHPLPCNALNNLVFTLKCQQIIQNSCNYSAITVSIWQQKQHQPPPKTQLIGIFQPKESRK